MEHTAKLPKFLSTIQRSVSASFRLTTDTMDLLSIRVKNEHVLSSLEQSGRQILDFYCNRRRQFNSLYRHKLCKDLLEPEELKKILHQAQSLGFAILSAAWYYENCHIVPVSTSRHYIQNSLAPL